MPLTTTRLQKIFKNYHLNRPNLTLDSQASLTFCVSFFEKSWKHGKQLTDLTTLVIQDQVNQVVAVFVNNEQRRLQT